MNSGWIDPPGFERMPAEAWHFEYLSMDHPIVEILDKRIERDEDE